MINSVKKNKLTYQSFKKYSLKKKGKLKTLKRSTTDPLEWSSLSGQHLPEGKRKDEM